MFDLLASTRAEGLRTSFYLPPPTSTSQLIYSYSHKLIICSVHRLHVHQMVDLLVSTHIDLILFAALAVDLLIFTNVEYLHISFCSPPSHPLDG
jgi:hypothetical protein